MSIGFENPVIERVAILASQGCVVDAIPAPILRRPQVYHFRLFSAGEHVSGVEVFVRDMDELLQMEQQVQSYLRSLTTDKSRRGASGG